MSPLKHPQEVVWSLQILAEGKDCMEEMQKKHKSNLEYIDSVRKEVAEVAPFSTPF